MRASILAWVRGLALSSASLSRPALLVQHLHRGSWRRRRRRCKAGDTRLQSSLGSGGGWRGFSRACACPCACVCAGVCVRTSAACCIPPRRNEFGKRNLQKLVLPERERKRRGELLCPDAPSLASQWYSSPSLVVLGPSPPLPSRATALAPHPVLSLVPQEGTRSSQSPPRRGRRRSDSLVLSSDQPRQKSENNNAITRV